MNAILFLLFFAFAIAAPASQPTAGSPAFVALLDTGVDVAVPEFQGRLAINLAEMAQNGKDDDRNGFVDDVLGWNFEAATPDIRDELGHGTNLAREVLHADPEARILPIKVTRRGVGIEPDRVAGAIAYAAARGARVIVIAFGLTKGSRALSQAIRKAHAEGIVIVCASGGGVENPFRPVDVSTLVPQNEKAVIVVGMAESVDRPGHQVNYGDKLDFVVARPDTLRGGTSYAAAWVGGLVARTLRVHPRSTPERIRKRLKKACQKAKSDTAMRFGAGVLSREKFFLENF